MQTHEPFPVHIRMRWLDFSPALESHTRQRMEAALHRFASRIRRVNVRVADANGPRGGADDKICEVEILLRPSGSLLASATAPDAYQSVALAAHRAHVVMRRHLARGLEREGRSPLEQIA